MNDEILPTPVPRPLSAALQARYRVGEVIGTGGMATVHRAHDPLLKRDVAVKVFKARATTPADLRAQEAEAQLLAALSHHALVTLFDAGVDMSEPDRPQIFLVMEHVRGSDLRTRLRRGPLTMMQVAWLGLDLCEGLEYVHEAGFLHHDVKPANVLIADRRAEFRLRGKLTDFGISSMIGQPEDGEFTTGTAAYLAPEQVEGLPATPAVDVYALGLVLLEAYTGRVAFPGSIEQSALARLDAQPEIPVGAPAGFVEVIRGMTARRPEDRMSLPDAIAGFRSLIVDGLIAERGLPASGRHEERERLAAVRGLGILDTPPDDAFDTVTRIAARTLGVPISIVTVIDDDRVWFKSKQGIDIDEVHRDTAFCSTTYPGGRAPWTISDVDADPRLVGNALVEGEPHVRSYAGAPLVSRDGHQLGALCVFDRRPREFDADELENLRDLASIVMHELELRQASRRALFAIER